MDRLFREIYESAVSTNYAAVSEAEQVARMDAAEIKSDAAAATDSLLRADWDAYIAQLEQSPPSDGNSSTIVEFPPQDRRESISAQEAEAVETFEMIRLAARDAQPDLWVGELGEWPELGKLIMDGEVVIIHEGPNGSILVATSQVRSSGVLIHGVEYDLSDCKDAPTYSVLIGLGAYKFIELLGARNALDARWIPQTI
jgi:hypothetical protein